MIIDLIVKMLRLKNLVPLHQRGAKIVVNSFKYNSTVTSADSSSDGGNSERIVIPKRINRGPTDVLQALSQTIGRDPTAAHYKYHDDPYLMPYSEADKRGFGLAQEAGRKTAQWIKRQHADLFQVILHTQKLFNFNAFQNVFSYFCAAYDGTAAN